MTMEIKLIAGDGCWKIENVEDKIAMRRDDIYMAVFPMIKASMAIMGDSSYMVTPRKRIYSYYGKDNHDMPIYKEIFESRSGEAK